MFHRDFDRCCELVEGRIDRAKMVMMHSSREALLSSEKFDAVLHVYPDQNLMGPV